MPKLLSFKRSLETTRADIPEVLRLMDKELGSTAYSLKSLFRDDRRAILEQILNTSLEEAEAAYRQIYEHHIPLGHFLWVFVEIGFRLAVKTLPKHGSLQGIQRSADDLFLTRGFQPACEMSDALSDDGRDSD